MPMDALQELKKATKKSVSIPIAPIIPTPGAVFALEGVYAFQHRKELRADVKRLKRLVDVV